MMNHVELKKLLIFSLESIRNKLPEDRYESTRELIAVGEEGLALDQLCSNIDDFGIDIPKDIFFRIKKAAEIMNVNRDSWKFIEDHVQ